MDSFINLLLRHRHLFFPNAPSPAILLSLYKIAIIIRSIDTVSSIFKKIKCIPNPSLTSFSSSATTYFFSFTAKSLLKVTYTLFPLLPLVCQSTPICSLSLGFLAFMSLTTEGVFTPQLTAPASFNTAAPPVPEKLSSLWSIRLSSPLSTSLHVLLPSLSLAAPPLYWITNVWNSSRVFP